jgi:kynureninase
MSNYDVKDFALREDLIDELKEFQDKFIFPQHDKKPVIYFTGNSLGLQPRSTRDAVLAELEDWGKYGVEGHFMASSPWFSYHEWFHQPAAKLVGALPGEVVVMNQLTSNLHFLMVSFYRPSPNRYKILTEAKAFPSDRYAVVSQIKFHGFDPKDALIEIAPREGKHTIDEEDINEAIALHGESLAMVFIGGVNYYSGQVFNMASITSWAHQVGAIAGFDLAHAAGNIELHLHDWQVDFAAWCSYIYLNSGPGGVAGAFVHQKHAHASHLPRFAGWWGHDKDRRFLMEPDFVPIGGAEGWQVSNAPVLSMAAHKASLEIFEQAGMQKLSKKGKKLSGYLMRLLDVLNEKHGMPFEIITPREEHRRGCQVSILVKKNGRQVFEKLTARGIIADWREPDVIRVAPVPLYNSFGDVYAFYEALDAILSD